MERAAPENGPALPAEFGCCAGRGRPNCPKARVDPRGIAPAAETAVRFCDVNKRYAPQCADGAVKPAKTRRG
jgi:hypothetical protein